MSVSSKTINNHASPESTTPAPNLPAVRNVSALTKQAAKKRKRYGYDETRCMLIIALAGHLELTPEDICKMTTARLVWEIYEPLMEYVIPYVNKHWKRMAATGFAFPGRGMKPTSLSGLQRAIGAYLAFTDEKFFSAPGWSVGGPIGKPRNTCPFIDPYDHPLVISGKLESLANTPKKVVTPRVTPI